MEVIVVGTGVIIGAAYIIGTLVSYPLIAWANGRWTQPHHQYENDYRVMVLFTLFWGFIIPIAATIFLMVRIGSLVLYFERGLRLAAIYAWFNTRGRSSVDKG